MRRRCFLLAIVDYTVRKSIQGLNRTPMQIVYHIGAHCTDEDALLRSLVKNKETLVDKRVALPNPSRYRQLVRETLQSMMGPNAPQADGNELLEKIVGRPDANRLIMSNRNFICVPNRIFEGGEFYALADAKFSAYQRLFEDHDLEIMLGIRDPATFVPAAFSQSKGRSFDSFLDGASIDDLYWSDLIDRMRHLLPSAKITVWCNEDTPFIWPKLLRALMGLSDQERVAGGYDLIASVLSDEGVKKLQSYFKNNPPKSEAQRQKVLAAFLGHFAEDDEVEEEITAPGWTEAVMEELSEAYDEDVEAISQRDDITFIEASL